MALLHLVYLLLGIVISRILYHVASTLASPLRDVPGPWQARFTRLWYLQSVRKGHFHLTNLELHRRYAEPGQDLAPIIRVGPKMYSLSEPAKVVYGIASKMPKSKWYEGWKHPSPERWTLFPDRHMKRHADTRRKFQGLYSLSSLVTYEQYVDQCSLVFLECLNELSGPKPIDLAYWFICYAFDVIGCITYSKRLGFMDNSPRSIQTLKALDKSLVYSTLIGIYHEIHPIMYRVMERIPGSGAASRNFLMKFAQEQKSQRESQRQARAKEGRGIEAQEDAPRDFLDRIMDMKEKDSGVTEQHIFMLGLSNIIAGSDTTAVSLSSVFYYLCHFPRVNHKLREEIAAMERQGISKNGQLKFKDCQNMPYLQSCIKEALRLHPAVGLPLWRVVPHGGAEINGRFFPAGTEVGVNGWVAHYDKNIWGEDGEQFRPERWTEEENEDRLKLMEAHYLPFGLGSRTCIGRHISYLEMSKLIPLLVWHFDFALERQAPWDTSNFWFVKPVNFNVRLHPRRKKV